MLRWRLLWSLSFLEVSWDGLGKSVSLAKNRKGGVDLSWYFFRLSRGPMLMILEKRFKVDSMLKTLREKPCEVSYYY